MNKNKEKIEVKVGYSGKYIELTLECRCGRKFKRDINILLECPEDYMCSVCNQKDSWKYHLRMLGLKKIKCVGCGWKLKYENFVDGWETTIIMKCPCCGLRFGLWHKDY